MTLTSIRPVKSIFFKEELKVAREEEENTTAYLGGLKIRAMIIAHPVACGRFLSQACAL